MAGSPDKRRKGAEHRERMARRMREQTASVADIGDLPKVARPRRRKACERDLFKYLTTYFPYSTGLSPFSADHRRVIDRVQQCVLGGGRFVNAVYRGFAKTSIAEGAALWATFYKHRRFVPIFGADGAAAEGNINSLKAELEDNDLLYEDFPEVCHAIRHLEGRPQRAMSQEYRGERTHVQWRSDQIVLPWIDGDGGAVICARGITAGFRGMKHKRPDGTQQRPDFILLDDPQTDEAAGSPAQVSKTLATLRKAIVKLGGHRKALAIVVNATVIQQDDAVEALLADPAWQGERIPLVRRWPDAHKTLWLEEYAARRRTFDKGDPKDQERARRAATEFYRGRRAEMDAGGEVSWDNCFDPDTEISALQHAYNALIDDGDDAFQSEYQQRPNPRIPSQPGDLKADAVAARLNGQPRGDVPDWASAVTAFIDVQQDLLWWAACAWSADFTGAVIDYGAWPDQGRGYFTLRDARPTLAAATGISSLDGCVYAGLTALTARLVGRFGQLERLLVDSGWNPTTGLVKRWWQESPHRGLVLPSKGRGIPAGALPISEWQLRSGERRGLEWNLRPARSATGRLLIYDVGWWKEFAADRLRQAMGERGALTLFGDDPAAHRMFVDHVVRSEYREERSAGGRTVIQWTRYPAKPDNHLLDCLVGCAVAASERGCVLAGGGKPAKAKTVSYAELYAQARERERGGR